MSATVDLIRVCEYYNSLTGEEKEALNRLIDEGDLEVSVRADKKIFNWLYSVFRSPLGKASDEADALMQELGG